jgi:glycosyltransferase involved in cell wall biosynthesis
MTASTVVVPCFNEADRLDLDRFDALVTAPGARVLAVDDGSTDRTGAILADLVARAPDRFQVLSLSPNRGKGEAVRQGMRAALDAGAAVVAYCDADFSTPPDEVARLVATLDLDAEVEVVLGSRIALMGSHIERSAVRHYTGRLFATASSLVLGVPVYDTQCGAKAFRATDALHEALAVPFSSRWAFDVELLGRLLHARGSERFVEMPLRHWHEAGGSKLTAAASLRTLAELVRIRRNLRRIERRPRAVDQTSAGV